MNRETTIRRDLHSFIANHFSLEELQILSFDLSIDYDHLVGEIKPIKIISLLLYALRNGRIPALMNLLKEYRPNVLWPDFSPDILEIGFINKDDLKNYPLGTLIDFYFDKSDIQKHCFDMGVNYENLVGDTKLAVIPSFLTALYEKRQIPDFMELIRQERPDVDWPPFTIRELGTGTSLMVLPRKPDHFVGREDDLQWLSEALQLGRVVTLWGAGGMGKTALAIEVLHRLRLQDFPHTQFKDGILFYSFYGHGEMDIAYAHIIRSFAPHSNEISEAMVRQVLSGKEALLVFDSTEEAENLSALLDCCDSCGVLLTTQKRTDAPEKAWRREVKPLQPTEARMLLNALQGENIPLLTANLICQQLGWMPLSVRLAGQFLEGYALTATEYLEWLQTTPIEAASRGNKKGESIQILLDKTIQHLSQQAQRILGIAGQLGQAPFVLGPIISASDMEAITVRAAIGELVNFGLAIRKEHHYAITHPLLHAYARQFPVDTTTFAKLVTYYNSLAQSQAQPETAEYLRLDDEYVHFIEILKGVEKRNDMAGLIELALALRYFWEIRGYWREGKQWLEKALAASESTYTGQVQQQIRGQIQLVLGGIYYRLLDFDRAHALLLESRENARQVQDLLTQARACRNLGLIQRNGLGDPNAALQFFEESLALTRGLDESIQHHEKARELLINEIEVSSCYLDKSMIDTENNDFESAAINRQTAQSLLQACLDHYRSLGIYDKQLEAHIYHGLGIAFQLNGAPSFVEAYNHYKQALHLSQQTGERGQMAELEACLGEVCFGSGQIQVALAHFDKSKTIAQEIRDRQMLLYLQDTVTGFQSRLASSGQEDLSSQYSLWLKSLMPDAESSPG